MKRITEGYIKTKRKTNHKDVKDRKHYYESNNLSYN